MRFPLPSAASPESLGIPSSAIHSMIRRLQRQQLVLHSVLLVRRGELVWESYWNPYTASTPHRMYSVAKSFVAVAIGVLVGEGRVQLKDRVIEYFPEIRAEHHIHPFVEEARIVDLLEMRTPHEDMTYIMTEDPDWVRTFFTVTPTRRPGTIFAYDTSATVVLTAVVERLSGQSLEDFLATRVFGPIGGQGPIQGLKTPTGLTVQQRAGRPSWREVEQNPQGVTHGGSGVFCLPRDAARFGLLLMRGRQPGPWEELVPATYLQEMTSFRTSAVTSLPHQRHQHPDDRAGYGFQIWLTRHGGFAARGMGGQLIVCLPDQDLIMVVTGDNQPRPDGTAQLLDALWDEVLPHLSAEPLPDDPAAQEALRADTDGLELSALPPGGKGVSVNRQYSVCDEAGHRFDLSIVTTAGEGHLTLYPVGEAEAAASSDTPAAWEIPFGIGRNIRHSLPNYGYETYSSGTWVDENTLHIRSMTIGLYHGHIEFTLHFSGEWATLVMQKTAEFFADEYQGVYSGPPRRR
ncbi:serine hydrolase domain-containing protein [Nesterenkonia alba]|uniref:serine hydrolase domain-containing protein n=1 Tax=Nesterenkonia alba TaxID=515814 RepID=UPI0003B49FDD|nr:serine hydrolase domain-containing protein [Nesterenkonia alba]